MKSENHIKENVDRTDIKNIEDKKNFHECKIYTGWQHKWVSPKRLSRINPIKIREVVRGPFYSPKLLKISPFVSISSCEDSCQAMRYRKTFGIPDPWTERLAIGYCSNEKYDQILKNSCVSRCMRFWITETVWKKMGLPFIQGIPDPDKDFSDIRISKNSSKRKDLKSEVLPHSKSLPNSLEKNILEKDFIPSNVIPSPDLIVTSEQETIEDEKYSMKQPEGFDEEVPDTRNHKNHSKRNSVVKTLDSNNYVNSKFLSCKCDNIKKIKEIKPIQAHFHPSLNVDTQTSPDRFHWISCQQSSFQTLLKIARKAILPRKMYKNFKERWTRKRCRPMLHQSRYFSSHISCHCMQATKKDLPNKIVKKLPDNSSTHHVINDYCPHCKAYIYKKTSDYRDRELIRDYTEKKAREDISLRSYKCFREKIQRPLRENVTTQTELMMQRVNRNDLRLICSRCNYPYFKAEMGMNVSTDRLVDHKISTYDNVNHHFQGKYEDKDKSTVPIVRLISKQDDSNFNDFMKYKHVKDTQENGQKKIGEISKETNSRAGKNRKTYDNDRTKEKIVYFSVGTQVPMISNSDVNAKIPEQSKYCNSTKDTSVTSNICLDRNETLTTSDKNKTIDTNKFKILPTNQNFYGKFPVLISDHEKNTYSKVDDRKIKKKQEEILNDRKDHDVISSTIKNESKRKKKSKNLIDSTRSPKEQSRTESKTKSKIKPKPKSSSKLKIKSTVKSMHNKSNLHVNKKYDKSNKSNSKSISKFKSESKPISKSRSKSTSKSRFKREPESTCNYVQTGSKIRSFKNLKNPNDISERENLHENKRNCLTEKLYNRYQEESTKYKDCNPISNTSIERNKFTKSSPLHDKSQVIRQKELFMECDSCVENDNNLIDDMISCSPMNDVNVKKKINENTDDKSTSMTGFNFDPGPCINRGTYNKIIDSNCSIYSSMQNLYRNNENGNRRFSSKKDCWLSKSDNCMNSNNKQEERKNDVPHKKGNDCYLKFCNSRYFSSIQSLSDDDSIIKINKEKGNKLWNG
ncbi:putative leucine-rich repeat-containing protein [Vespula squamosa]|uniref:Leucine-rich repeat-containing protein n=1 Tax=Vespula squamosa TaxID=30214 RepID=A0ABD2ATF4_VESSQ